MKAGIGDWLRTVGLSLGIALALAAVLCVVDRCAEKNLPPAVTVRTDTVRVTVPVARDTVYLRSDTVRYTAYRDRFRTVYKTDTLVKVDTVSGTVTLPITRKTYRDSGYTAIVSGYSPSLDYIETYNRTVTRTVVRPSRFSLGVGAGCYITPKGLQPGLGVTLQYNLLGIK